MTSPKPPGEKKKPGRKPDPNKLIRVGTLTVPAWLLRELSSVPGKVAAQVAREALIEHYSRPKSP